MSTRSPVIAALPALVGWKLSAGLAPRGGQEFHPVLGDLFRARHAELQHPVVDASIASERGFHLLLVDLGPPLATAAGAPLAAGAVPSGMALAASASRSAVPRRTGSPTAL